MPMIKLNDDGLVYDGVHTCWEEHGGQRLYRFVNGFGASVLNGSIDTHLPYELAVLKWDGDEFETAYDTPISCEVEHGAAEQINEMLAAIAALGPRTD